MKERLWVCLSYLSILSAIFAIYFTSDAFKKKMDEQLRESLKNDVRLVENAYANLDSIGELSAFANDALRITLIGNDGSVLYESKSEKQAMDNHFDRPEVQSAREKGTGEDLRYSITLKANVFYYATRLKDGNILRIGICEANLQHIFSKMTPSLIALLAIILIVSVLISFILSNAFIKPIKNLAQKLNDPEELQQISYKEIAPFVETIRKQNHELETTIELLIREKSRISQLKDEFTANASHELKTPLTSISGYAEMIENGMAKPEDVRRFATKIHSEANRLLNITNDIMTLSKLNESNAKDNMDEIVDLNKTANAVVSELNLAAMKKNIELSVICAEKSMHKGNGQMLFEMLYNLVDNAIRYTENGGHVQVTVSENSIKVKDDGIGIPEEAQGRIFERFFRVDKSRSKVSGGTGLGLSIVKHIAEVHHANVLLKSRLGEGSEFTVQF